MFFKKKKDYISEPTTNESSKSLFSRLKEGMSKTASKFSRGINTILMGQKVVDEELIDEIEAHLLIADFGIETTRELVEYLRAKVSRRELQTSYKLNQLIKLKLKEILLPSQKPLKIAHNLPYVILLVGVNGVGKTTTIGKLAKKINNQGKSVMLAAGDTFRAAAVEQLKELGDRNNVPVVAAKRIGLDSASVLYDAIILAKNKQIDVIIADTAGRLHTKDNLMEELKKIIRVIKKVDQSAPHEIMLVLDSTTGQNALSQTKVFNDTVKLTSIIVTKLDGTAKGGVLFSIARRFSLPIRYIGIGEGADDLQEFNANDFVESLF